jgi:NitT/TauT family transport system permease protein
MAVPTPVAGTQTEVRTRSPRARRISLGSSWWKVLIVLGILIGLWYAWAAVESHKGLGFLVPYPHQVWSEGFADSQARSAILTALEHSVVVTFAGLFIAIVIGVVWAMIMAQARWAEQALFPYAVVLQCIPIFALVPLIGALSGANFKSRLIVTVMFGVFPMVANTLFGLQSVDRGQRELFRLAGAGRLTMLRKLQLPAALPSIFVGLRTSAGLSVIGAIVSDQFFQRGSPGLGALIEVDESRVLGPAMWAALLVACALGVAIFVVFGLLGRLAVGRWHDFS